MSVHVVVKNVGKETRTITTNQCPDAFLVLSADSTVVGPSNQVCSLLAIETTLQPGEEFSWTQDWTGGGLDGAVDKSTGLLPPGTYSVKARTVPTGSVNPSTPITIDR